tara:strand:- start:290 stop:481 length:192 start_codon:yes stop_codon:yes gene_type:complete
VIKIEMDVRAAAAVRQSLFTDTKMYTYDPKSVPPRVTDIRSVIQDLDEQIEVELKKVEEDSNS